MSLASGALSEKELLMQRRDYKRKLTSRCQILRPSSTFNEGGEVTTFTVVASDVPCRTATVNVMSSGEQVIASGFEGVALWKIVLPAMTDIRKPDVIIRGVEFAGSGITEQQLNAADVDRFGVVRVSERDQEITRVVYGYKIGD